MRTIPERLHDIQNAITHIMKYTREGRARYDHDELVQALVIYNLYIVGEATRATASDFPAFKDQHSEIKWSKIIGMRTFLAHRYFDMDLNILWSVVSQDLYDMKCCIDAILEQDKKT